MSEFVRRHLGIHSLHVTAFQVFNRYIYIYVQSGFGVYISLVESAFSRVNDHSIERKEKETRRLEKKIRSRFSFRASVLYITLRHRSLKLLEAIEISFTRLFGSCYSCRFP